MIALSTIGQIFSLPGLRRKSEIAARKVTYANALAAHRDAIRRGDTRDMFTTRIALTNATTALLAAEARR